MGYYGNAASTALAINTATKSTARGGSTSGASSKKKKQVVGFPLELKHSAPATGKRRYHINAEGEPGLCKANYSCPFGDMNADHFPTKVKAREAYEAQMQDYEQFKNSRLGKLDRTVDKVANLVVGSYKKFLDWTDKNPVKTGVFASVAALAVGAYVGAKIGEQITKGFVEAPTAKGSKYMEGTIVDFQVEGTGKYKDVETTVQFPGMEPVKLNSREKYVSAVSGDYVGTEVKAELWDNGEVHTNFSTGYGASGEPPTPEGIHAGQLSAMSAVGAWTGGAFGAVGGAVTAYLSASMIDKSIEYFEARWTTRHGNRFSLLRQG